ncbi:hypothetical protein STCU_00020 [Strigomonas culicis]|nr:hypothetical protein STCU_00020 [Strigomonas culicis]|eukprot:EPY37277.1 hypothetical protein STCU_00020 [Strigomonas culicis]
MHVAENGVMTPSIFQRYVAAVGVYKERQVQLDIQRMQQQRKRHHIFSFSKKGDHDEQGGSDSGSDAEDLAAAPEEEMYLHLFRGYDFDGDGVITFKEFLMYHMAVVYSTEELFFVVFNAYDEDGDGYLSLGDIQSVITAATRYVGDYDVRDREVRRVIHEEARRLMGFLDIRKEGRVRMDDMHLVVQKYPEVLEKMKNLM